MLQRNEVPWVFEATTSSILYVLNTRGPVSGLYNTKRVWRTAPNAQCNAARHFFQHPRADPESAAAKTQTQRLA